MQRLKAIFLVAGLALLAYAVIASGGITSVAWALLRMRWWFLLALASTFIAQLVRTLAWGVVVESYTERPSFATLYRIRLGGEALNYLSVAGPFLGDPAKAFLLSSEIGFKKAGTTVALDRYLYSVPTILFVVTVASAWFNPFGIWVPIALGSAIALSPLWVARYTRSLSPSRMYRVIALHLFSQVFMVLEVAILLRGLHVDASLPQTFFVEAMAKGMNGLFFFVPMQVGVFEGGHAMLLHYLNIGTTLGLTLGLARRARSLFWAALGLALLWKSRQPVKIEGKLAFSGLGD